jgi:hypothetical protein
MPHTPQNLPPRLHRQVAFAFAADALPRGLALRPVAGVAPPRGHALVSLRFTPAAAGDAVALDLPVIFNHTPMNSGALRVTGAAHAPVLSTSLAPSNRLFLRPTCVGASSARTVEVVNPGRVAAGWQWAVSRRLAGVVTVTPEVRGQGRSDERPGSHALGKLLISCLCPLVCANLSPLVPPPSQCGVLQGGESCEVAVVFTPRAAAAYEARAALLVLPPEAVAGGGAGAADQAARAAMPCEEDAPEAATAAVGGGPPDAAAAAARKLVFNVAGEGTPGALALEPAGGVRFGAVRVGYREARALTLVNQSEGLLSYRIVLEEEEEEEEEGEAAASPAADEDDGGCSAGRSSSAGPARPEPSGILGLAAAMATADAGAEPILFEDAPDGSSSSSSRAGGGGGDAPEWWVDAPEGVVPGRCQKTVTVTLLPRRRRRYCLWLSVCDPSSAAAAAAAPAAGSGAWAPPPLAVAEVTADAVYPMVLVTDVACDDGTAKQVAWQQLGLPALNAALACPVTPLERRARALADRGALTTDSAAALLPPLPLDLGPLPLGGPGRRVALRLENPGPLPAAWELHSYDDPEVGGGGAFGGPAESHPGPLPAYSALDAHLIPLPLSPV